MALNHVPQSPGGFIKRRSAFDTERLGSSDLHVVDVVAVPERLEDAVTETKNEQVLDSFLPQVMVDAIDLRLIENRKNLGIQHAGRCAVSAERLLDDDARPRTISLWLGKTGASELLDDVGVNLRWCGYIEETIAAQLTFTVEFLQSLGQAPVGVGVVVIARKISCLACEMLAFRFLRAGSLLLGYGLRRDGAELLIAHRSAREPQQSKPRRQAGMDGQIVERRQQLPLRQVARSTEHDHRTRFLGDLAVVAIGSSRFRDVNACASAHDSSLPSCVRKVVRVGLSKPKPYWMRTAWQSHSLPQLRLRQSFVGRRSRAATAVRNSGSNFRLFFARQFR